LAEDNDEPKLKLIAKDPQAAASCNVTKTEYYSDDN